MNTVKEHITVETKDLKTLAKLSVSFSEYLEKDLTKENLYSYFFRSPEARRYFRENIFLPETFTPLLTSFLNEFTTHENIVKRFINDEETPQELKQFYKNNKEWVAPLLSGNFEVKEGVMKW